MYYFKYFRNDIYFEKLIRYNELFFASNSTLNDPMDLWLNPVIWDDVEKWKKLLDIRNELGLSVSDYISMPEDDSFYSDLNDLFKNKYLIQVINEKKALQLKVSEIISNYQLASGEDILSSASVLVNNFSRMKNDISILSVSFSKDPFNYLMWSHYANGFKGCILIYEMKDKKTKLKQHIFGDDTFDVEIQDVEYSDKINQIDLWKMISENIINDNLLFFTKNKQWSYERESRLVLLAKMESTGEILHHDTSLVKGVIFGSRCDHTFKKKVINALKGNRLYDEHSYFLCFESALNEKNEITLTSGSIYKPKENRQQKLSKDEIAAWNKKISYTNSDNHIIDNVNIAL